jgi:hypothetical protein
MSLLLASRTERSLKLSSSSDLSLSVFPSTGYYEALLSLCYSAIIPPFALERVRTLRMFGLFFERTVYFATTRLRPLVPSTVDCITDDVIRTLASNSQLENVIYHLR